MRLQKITQKNSWALNLIDYLPDVLETQYKTEDGIANFQAASVTLDTSVKIYSYRVDSVHTETYKVLGGLSRTDARPDEEGDEAGKMLPPLSPAFWCSEWD